VDDHLRTRAGGGGRCPARRGHLQGRTGPVLAPGRHRPVGDAPLINLCSNNYLGLADHPHLLAAAGEALQRWGFGMASVRFICGTQEIHTELEERLSAFLGTEATILYSSCFDANAGLFEVLLDEDDAVISDALNHASIIDGIRLCKATRYRYANRDLADLERCLAEARGARRRLVVTDGVFSMDGYLAPLDGICELADRYDALVVVDDSHAVGFVGPGGRGTPEHFGVADRVDLLTGTLGKALGGASGGYVSGRREVDRPAASALPPLPVLQLAGPTDRGSLPGGAGSGGGFRRTCASGSGPTRPGCARRCRTPGCPAPRCSIRSPRSWSVTLRRRRRWRSGRWSSASTSRRSASRSSHVVRHGSAPRSQPPTPRGDRPRRCRPDRSRGRPVGSRTRHRPWHPTPLPPPPPSTPEVA
jgi:hypothetical protein